MLNEINNFLLEKQGVNNLFEDIIYICQAGSHTSGTNDETSDYDFRGIVLLNEDYRFGLKKFEHVKLTSGKKGINLYQDLDLELFSVEKFIETIYLGHFIPAEMLFVEEDFILLKNDWFEKIYKQREIFLSQKINFHYMSYIKGCIKRIFLPIDNVKKEDKKLRILNYGYETKEAMKAIQLLRLTNEFLKTHNLNIYRKDKTELLSIKQGKFTKNQVKSEIDDLLLLNKELEKTTTLPKNCHFQKVNDFLKNFNKEIIKGYIK